MIDLCISGSARANDRAAQKMASDAVNPNRMYPNNLKSPKERLSSRETSSVGDFD
jgi:hypothetical protein